MKKQSAWSLTLILTLGACAPKAAAGGGPNDPSGSSPSGASDGMYESSEHVDAPAPGSSPEDATTLKFPFCERDMKTPFSAQSEGAAFRAIVLFRILPSGKTAEHCYLRVEGDIKWEERSLGNVADWSYPAQFAGEQRERTVTFRLNKPPAADQPAADQPTSASAAPDTSAAPTTTGPAPRSSAVSAAPAAPPASAAQPTPPPKSAPAQ